MLHQSSESRIFQKTCFGDGSEPENAKACFLEAAQQEMASAIEHVYYPRPARVAEYEVIYQQYLRWAETAEPLLN